ncbi:MAG TPA: LptF/LptG family permease [Alphaproteobacteria bacterium]|nr:LptF/LptG family permease [Alphaproteobacteria bacterium]
MKIIKRYFTKQLITIFTMLLLVLTGLAWMLQIMSLMKFLINYGVEVYSFIGLTVLMIPFIVSIIIPFVTFIAIMFVYNKLISDNEITVLAASGLSPRQVAKPAMVLVLFLTIINWGLNIWAVPVTQAKFYDTQWELRYGLAHMKLKESAFNQMAEGLVVYVDKVSGYDLSQIILYDSRSPRAERTIFAEKGKLISTARGLSIVMNNGSLQSRDDNLTIGTFDSFDMDLNIADRVGESVFKVRRIPTTQLLKNAWDQRSFKTSDELLKKQQKLTLTEIYTRLLSPLMNVILAALCLVILLRTSLLRRRTSFAPVIAVAVMAIVSAFFMSASNMVETLPQLGILMLAQLIVLSGILFALFKK